MFENIAEPHDPLYSRKEAARYLTELGLETAPQTLARKFHEGTGPLCTHVADRAMYRAKSEGGGGTLVGAAIGAFILVPLSEILRAFGTFRIVIYCIILTGFIVFKSEGIMIYLQRKYHQFERWVKV